MCSKNKNKCPVCGEKNAFNAAGFIPLTQRCPSCGYLVNSELKPLTQNGFPTKFILEENEKIIPLEAWPKINLHIKELINGD